MIVDRRGTFVLSRTWHLNCLDLNSQDVQKSFLGSISPYFKPERAFFISRLEDKHRKWKKTLPRENDSEEILNTQIKRPRGEWANSFHLVFAAGDQRSWLSRFRPSRLRQIFARRRRSEGLTKITCWFCVRPQWLSFHVRLRQNAAKRK